MADRYQIETTGDFDKKFEKLCKRNKALQELIIQRISLLRNSPFEQSLNTHKVNTKKLGQTYSTRVNGDLRILWKMKETKFIILCLTIGGHDQVYN